MCQSQPAIPPIYRLTSNERQTTSNGVYLEPNNVNTEFDPHNVYADPHPDSVYTDPEPDSVYTDPEPEMIYSNMTASDIEAPLRRSNTNRYNQELMKRA